MTNTQQPLKVITKDIKIPAHDGDAFAAYVAMPEDASKDKTYPAIILIQEIFGVNQEMRNKCDDYAAQGYITICPDLFWRIEPNIQLVDSNEAQLQRAFDLFAQFAVDIGIDDLKTTIGYVRNMTECNKKIGSIGFCLGGKLSYMLSARSDIDASVSYYGVNIETMLDLSEKINTPLLMHIASEDEFVDKDAQNKILDGLRDNKNVLMHQYEGQNHAFARGQGMHYDETAAALANSRTAEFLKKHLS